MNINEFVRQLNRYTVGPYYWEKCAGPEPTKIVEAHSADGAIEEAKPFPWNHTFGARARLIEE